MIIGQQGDNTDTIPTSSVEEPARDRTSTLRAVIETLRPQQWVKNGFIFAALIFSQSLTRWDRCRQVLLATLVFCIVSSATYVLNDILDTAEDRHHPTKKLRPIASGRLSPTTTCATLQPAAKCIDGSPPANIIREIRRENSNILMLLIFRIT